jgi:hypothetical protein
LEVLVPRAVNGRADLDFAGTGLAWTLTLPVTDRGSGLALAQPGHLETPDNPALRGA